MLLTGFERFGSGQPNPSGQVAECLRRKVLRAHEVRAVVLPCRFGAAAEILQAAIRRYRPRLVVCLGLAETRRDITPEAWAYNRVDARIPDNAGVQPRRQPVRGGGPRRWRATLPVAEIAAALRAAGLPARVSRSAGRFVCNEVFYRLMDGLPPGGGVRAGFIHLPPLAVKGRGGPGLSLREQVRAVRIAIEVALAAG